MAELSEFPCELAELKWCDDDGLGPLWCVHNATASKGKTKHYLNIYYLCSDTALLGRFSLEQAKRKMGRRSGRSGRRDGVRGKQSTSLTC
eukprot:COSAG01_NODE_12520_length_1726_cov_1.371850_1_plen_90_part_00